jgi:DNA-binding CsgD family transcriptional regulator
MRLFLLLYALMLFSPSNGSVNADLFKDLEEAIKQKDYYTQKKLEKIHLLTEKLHFYEDDKNSQMDYFTCLELFYEYQSFVYDSAFTYVEKAKMKALEIKDPTLLSYAKIRQGFVLLSAGLFKEAIDTLMVIPVMELPDTIKCEYYSVIARSYYDLADYNHDPPFAIKYRRIGNQYLDSALLYVPENSNNFWAIESLRRMKIPDWRGARYAFEYWMQNHDLPRHHYAIATSSLGYIYSTTGHTDKAIEFLTKAAIADIKTATKETVALRNLANILFQQGEKKKAYRYIVMALEDATYYNARHRKIEIATILPIIEGERLAVVEGQKIKLIGYILALTILSILVLVFLLVIYRQLGKINKVKLILQETNQHLNLINKNLVEANKIKEEYIGYFFNINSEFIEKIDAFQKSIYRKVVSRQFDDILSMVKSTDLKRERENLYQNFDEIFLKLFSNFVAEFNNLLAEEDRIVLKKDELLTPELRIFALMRLGIRDNEKIARFLNYSVNTIYTYKTKIKSKTIFREQFEEKLMAIRTE